MPKLRAAQSLVALCLWITAAIPSAGCSCIYINGECSNTDDCLTVENYSGKGVVCDHGFCKCPDEGDQRGVACCPDGRQDCPQADYECRTVERCEELLLASVGCSAPPPACTSDAECPGPPDRRCGTGVCTNGRCALDVRASQPIENQYPGDCKTTVCSPAGALVEWSDPSDLPEDGNPCTYDLCEAGEPQNPSMPENHPCTGESIGICVAGQCKECSESIDVMCLAGLKCHLAKCVPMTCTDTIPNGQETDVDCGGPECPPCDPGNLCAQASDCTSGVCTGGVCQAPTHTDGIKNDDETGVDCGYPAGPTYACEHGEGCKDASDCKSAVCYSGICLAPTCKDAVKNGSETGPDCGGECPPCPT